VNVANAADCFAGCTSLAALTIPTGTWKPDIDLSACATFTKAAMLAVIDGLYTYASGTHTVTFNSTVWDALSQADQQQVYNAADAKGWTTNAVAVSYVVSGTSSNVNGTETFPIQFIQDNAQTPDTAETITVNVDANGDWSFEYSGKKIYSLHQTFFNNTTVLSLEFTEEMMRCVTAEKAFNISNIANFSFPNATFAALTNPYGMFANTKATEIYLPNATFESVTTLQDMFSYNSLLQTINLPKATFENATIYQTSFLANSGSLKSVLMPKATFAKLTSGASMFAEKLNLETLDLSEATFAAMTATSDTNANGMFRNTPKLTAVSMPEAIFGEVALARQMFQGCGVNGIKIDMPKATFAKCTNAFRMFNRYGRAYGNIAEINMPLATFDLLPTGTGLDGAVEMFGQNSNLTKLTVPNSSTLDAAISLSDAPLGYNSLLAVANWLKDLTGGTAKTVTFKTSAWNALTAAEQSNIDTILSGKNWTRVLA